MLSEEGVMRIASRGHAVFAATLIVLGLAGLIKGTFVGIWDGVPRGFPGRELLAYLCALIALSCGVGLFSKRWGTSAARVLLIYLVLWTVLFKGRLIVLHPAMEVVYQTCGENLVLIAGTWVLYAWFAGEWDRQRLGFATGDRGVRIATVLYALAMLAFGLSHFAYLDNTAPLVPGWLPGHVAWAYFTGTAYLAAGVAMLIGVYAPLAAALSALQMGGFTLLVWVPKAVAGDMSAFDWSELCVSWALTAAGWVVADSYRGVPWLAVRKRRPAALPT
jgi:uncharacterized membrane protein